MLIQYPECNLQISDKALSALTAAFRCKHRHHLRILQLPERDVQKNGNGYQMDSEASINALEI